MEAIKSGDIFIFSVDSKHGLIQVIEKSKISGHNVRVFCDLIIEINHESIEKIIAKSNFFYIRNFYTYELLNKSVCKYNFRIPDGIKMPQYMRVSERKLNGDLYWYVFDVDKGTLVKTYKTYNEELGILSPSSAWGIEYIKKLWSEQFTLNNWHILEDKWYAEYLKAYEPERLKSNKAVSINNYLDIKPTNNWYLKNRLSSELIHEIDDVLINFVNEIISKALTDLQINELIEFLVNSLNAINRKNSFIETEEREEIIEYINYVITMNGYTNDLASLDLLREW